MAGNIRNPRRGNGKPDDKVLVIYRMFSQENSPQRKMFNAILNLELPDSHQLDPNGMKKSVTGDRPYVINFEHDELCRMARLVAAKYIRVYPNEIQLSIDNFFDDIMDTIGKTDNEDTDAFYHALREYGGSIYRENFCGLDDCTDDEYYTIFVGIIWSVLYQIKTLNMKKWNSENNKMHTAACDSRIAEPEVIIPEVVDNKEPSDGVIVSIDESHPAEVIQTIPDEEIAVKSNGVNFHSKDIRAAITQEILSSKMKLPDTRELNINDFMNDLEKVVRKYCGEQSAEEVAFYAGLFKGFSKGLDDKLNLNKNNPETNDEEPPMLDEPIFATDDETEEESEAKEAPVEKPYDPTAGMGTIDKMIYYANHHIC